MDGSFTRRLREDRIETRHGEDERLHHGVRALTAAEGALGESRAAASDGAGEAGDVTRDVGEQEVDSILKQAERQRLVEVEAARHRVATGSYGICEACQRPIATRRLFAVTWARRCIDCARGGVELMPSPDGKASASAWPGPRSQQLLQAGEVRREHGRR